MALTTNATLALVIFPVKHKVHFKFNLTGVRTQDLQIMNSTFPVPETLSSYPLGYHGLYKKRTVTLS